MRYNLPDIMRFISPFFLLAATFLTPPASAQTNGGADEANIDEISLESLLDVEVSTASKYEQTAREAPASVSVITAEDIDRFGYRTLAEALASVRGFYLDNDHDRTYLGARGFGKPGEYTTRVLILLDGHTVNEASTGWAPIDTQLCLDMATVERIEVVRGPGSALYGTGAMFAVINVVTKGAGALAGPRVSATLGSYGEQRGAASYATALESGLEMTVAGLWGRFGGADLYFEEFDTPHTNDGVAEGRDWEAYYGVALSASRGPFSVHGRYTAYEGGSPTAPAGRAFNSEHAKKSPQQGFVELGYEQAFAADKRLTLRSYFDHIGLRSIDAYATPGGEVLNRFQGFSNGLGAEARFQWDTGPKNRLTVGAEYRYAHIDYRAQSKDSLLFQLDRPYRVASIYVQDEYHLTRSLAATVGLRHDRYAEGGSASTPRAALAYHPSRSGTLKLLYGQAFRAPSVEERYSNADLDPERIHTVEAVWEQELWSRLSGTLSLYQFWADDLIGPVYDAARRRLQQRNIGRVTARGAELGLSARSPSGRHAYVRYAFQQAFNATAEPMPLTDPPGHVLKAGAIVPLLGPLYAAPEARYETRRTTLGGSSTNPHLLLNVTLSAQALLKRLDLSVGVRNALDVQYELPAGFAHHAPAGLAQHQHDALPQYGRTLSFSATYRL